MAFPPVKLPLSFTVMSFFLLSYALDMSIITYDNSHYKMKHPIPNRSEDEVLALHKSWVVKHGKVYNEVGEKEKRFEIFKDNLKFIDVHNSVHTSYKLGVNHFADMTNEEYQSLYLSGKILDEKTRLNNRSTSSDRYRFKDDEKLPGSVDWRTAGAVGPVRNQGLCRSSWAFSAVGAVEGINRIVTGDMIILSEQELIDCDSQFNQGCRGGIMGYAFEFIIRNDGIDTDEDYPYTALDGACSPERKNARVVSIDSYEEVPFNDEKSLKKAVASQPVSVAIDARSRKFQFYQSGIYDGPCGTNLNQGVNVVGYGSTEKGTDYWVVRNSWGEKWGEKGYIRLQRNVPNTPTGKCGIAMQGSYPVKNVDTVQ